VRATVRKVFVAVLAVDGRGLDRVSIRGVHEPLTTDPSAGSRHEVYRRVSVIAAEAYRYFHLHASTPASVLSQFLVRHAVLL
jgi:hypothetical protein